MAGKIVADTLEHSTAGSIGTNYLKEGTKCWLRYNQSTPSVLDSFNISSVADTATGKYTPSFTNSMLSSTDFAASVIRQAVASFDHNVNYTQSETSSNALVFTVENQVHIDGVNNHFSIPGGVLA
tara:strand:+ start:151 stop:525 length:375 start_codon:yes stop_codon:yes gene_type:complete